MNTKLQYTLTRKTIDGNRRYSLEGNLGTFTFLEEIVDNNSKRSEVEEHLMQQAYEHYLLSSHNEHRG